MNRQTTIIIGLGTGRCGTKSLSGLLNAQVRAEVYHEKSTWGVPWCGGESAVDEMLLWCSASTDRRILGDVGFYYLPYVSYILDRTPQAKFVCLKRNRAETVASYLEKTEGRNHWMVHDGLRWRHDRWDDCYPKYEAATKAEAIGRYWDEYYREAERYSRERPGYFRVFPMETLNTEAGQCDILAFLGLASDEMCLDVGVRLNRGRVSSNPAALHLARQPAPSSGGDAERGDERFRVPSTSISVNRYFDHVYVINLERRPDRKLDMLQKLRRLKIEAEFVVAVDGADPLQESEWRQYFTAPLGLPGAHPLELEQQRKLITSPGAWAYLRTWASILRDASRRRFQRILCFDDDVLFSKDFDTAFRELTERVPADWVLLYLGASQFNWNFPRALRYSDDSKLAYDACEPYYFPIRTDGSFAIGVQSAAFELLLSEIERMQCTFDSGALRSVIAAYPDKCFVANRNIVIADVSESDIRESASMADVALRLNWDLAGFDTPFVRDLVSVIMPAFNAERTISRSIRSVLSQTYDRFELIVADDASDDGTGDVVRRLMREDARIRLIRSDENLGAGGARNLAIQASSGVAVIMQDADDISIQDRFVKQLLPLYEQGVDFTLAKIYRSRCQIEELDSPDDNDILAAVASKRTMRPDGSVDPRDLERIAFASAAIRRDVLETVGLYRHMRFAEDMELFERLLLARLGMTFSESACPHRFLTFTENVPRIYRLVNQVLLVSPALSARNLMTQFADRADEVAALKRDYRDALRRGIAKPPPRLVNRISEGIDRDLHYNTADLASERIPVAELDELRTAVERLEEQASNLAARLDAVAKERDSAITQRNRMLQTLSWRMTQPLRVAGQIAAALRRRSHK